MSIRNTLIVLVLLALIGGYAYYSSKQPVEEKNKLFNIKSDDITGINLKYPDREIELSKEGGKWTLVKPLEAAADDTAVSGITRAVADCEVKKTLEGASTDLAAYGLAKPQVVVTVTTSDKKTMPGIEVGRTTPVGFSAYIKTTDKPAVMLTSSAFPPAVIKTVNELRDRQLLKFDPEDLQKFTIEDEGAPPIELEQQNGEWLIVKPAKYVADQTVVRQFLNSLTGIRVDEFVSEKPASLSQYGLEKPRVTIAVYVGKQAARQSLEFGLKEPNTDRDVVYVRRGESAPVYTVQRYAFDDLNKTLFELRDKTMLTFEQPAVAEIKFTSPKGFTLKRVAEGKWQVLQGNSNFPADVSEVSHFLDKLRDAKAKSIQEDPMTDPKKFGLDNPSEEITLIGKDGKLIGDLKLVRIERRNQVGGATPAPVARVDYYAKSSASSAVFGLDNLGFEDLSMISKEFLAPTPTPEETPPPKSASTITPHPAPSQAK